MGKGIFIVIDGIDGTGKKTQTDLLVRRLRSEGREVEIADFPQYGKKSAGLVEEYLHGVYGTAADVGPYRASVFYAVDRYDAGFKIKEWLEQGKIVISNRYVTANMGHQGGKISNLEERKKYFAWLDNFEYEIFKIPRPDINIILHVDAKIASEMVNHKGDRTYLNDKKRDIHEEDINHLKDSASTYLEIARLFPDFALVDCVKNGQLMAREEISDLIWDKIKVLL